MVKPSRSAAVPLALAALLAAALPGAPSAGAADKDKGPPIKPDQLKPKAKFTVSIEAVAGGTRKKRECLVWLPDNFDPKQAHPVIVHSGYNQHGEPNEGQAKFVRELVGGQNFIVLQPVHIDGAAEHTPNTGLLVVKELAKVMRIDEAHLVLSTTSYGNHAVDKTRAAGLNRYSLRIHWGAEASGAEPAAMRGSSSLFLLGEKHADMPKLQKSLARLKQSGADVELKPMTGDGGGLESGSAGVARTWLYDHWPEVKDARAAIAKAEKENNNERQARILKDFKDAWFKQDDVEKARLMYERLAGDGGKDGGKKDEKKDEKPEEKKEEKKEDKKDEKKGA